MSLDLINEIFNNLKENKFVQNFIKELSNYLENNITNNPKINNKSQNLMSEDLTLYNNKIITKYRDKILLERNNILQNYAEKTKELGEMYYIYNNNISKVNSYDLCACNKNNEVLVKSIEELPQGATLGAVLRKQGKDFILDVEATKVIEEEINKMIQEKIEEQNKYLESRRINGHMYEVGEKYSGRIWLYDLNNTEGGGIEGIEEIEFPTNLYEKAKEGDIFIYQNGEYQYKEN